MEEEQPHQFVVYATSKNGDGRVMEIGRYTSIEEVDIHIGHFADDDVISFEYIQ